MEAQQVQLSSEQKKGLEDFFQKMWVDYGRMNPQANAVYQALVHYGEKVVNDHIALRTFSHPHIQIDQLARPFINYGYQEIANYRFEQKKLRAKHYENNHGDWPKVFISELDLSLLSPWIQDLFLNLAESISAEALKNEDFVLSGRPWKADYSTYQKLYAESEYAAWLYAHGFRPNHFTVYVNELKKLNSIQDLNHFLKQQGFPLNSFGSEVKGTPQDYLEQSSTMANMIDVQFSDGVFKIPGCYYEFAKRYKLPNGKLFQGFVATSADKIFQSTHQQ